VQWCRPSDSDAANVIANASANTIANPSTTHAEADASTTHTDVDASAASLRLWFLLLVAEERRHLWIVHKLDATDRVLRRIGVKVFRVRRRLVQWCRPSDSDAANVIANASAHTCTHSGATDTRVDASTTT